MYSKIFQQIFQSSIAADYELRHIFMDLLVLADRNGRIDHTYEAIARTINVPVEKVVVAIGQLMRPDPESRSPEFEGARLMLIDPTRAWGWRITNYRKYRNRQYDDLDKRRAYRREWMRKNRPSRAKNPQGEQGWTGVDKGEQGCTGVNRGEQRWTGVENQKPQNPDGKQLTKFTVNRGELQAEAEAEAKVPVCSLNNLGTSRARARAREEEQAETDLIEDFQEAKNLICKLILNGKDPNRQWSYQAEQNLVRQLPIPKAEIERIAWFRGLADDGSPELERRKVTTETGLTEYWGDEVTRANAFWQKLNGWCEKGEAAR